MRLIGSLADKHQVERFVAYLITENISVQVESDGSQFQVWARDEDQVAKASKLLHEFSSAPDDPKYNAAVAAANEILQQRTRQRREARRRVHTSADLRVMPRYRAPLSLFLFGVMIAIWVATGFGHRPFNDAMRIMLFTSIDLRKLPQQEQDAESESVRLKTYNIAHGQLWRLVTPAFIHFGAMHMIFNLMAWLMLGRPLEHRYGTMAFALLVLSLALVSNVLQAIVPEQLGGTELRLDAGAGTTALYLIMPFGGLSGVVYGLIGFAWIKSVSDPSFGYYMPISLVIWAIAWFYLGVSELDERWLGIAMANWAHGSGFVLGILAGLVTTYLKTNTAKRPPRVPRRSE